MRCKICKILEDQEVKFEVWGQEKRLWWVSFKSNLKLASTHYLIVPVMHFDGLLYPEGAIRLFLKRKRLKNYRVMVNQGSCQHIKHLHIHIMAGTFYKKWRKA